MKLGGVIYLHNITEKRMRGTTKKNLDMFHQLCGDKALARVILGTTNWGEIDKEKGKDREKDLAANFWKTMIDSGSKLFRFYETQESALVFLDVILGQLEFYKNGKMKNDISLQIQNELINRERSIRETSAGKELRSSLQQDFEAYKTDRDAAKTIREQVDELHVPLGRKLYLKFFVSR